MPKLPIKRQHSVHYRVGWYTTVHCQECGTACPPGQRRRGPIAEYYCRPCGKRLWRRLRAWIQRDAVLQECLRRMPSFLRYVDPTLMGLAHVWPPERFHRAMGPRARKPPRREHPVVCLLCGVTVGVGAQARRSGGASFCHPCGRRYRRCYRKERHADAQLSRLCIEFPQCTAYLRPELVVDHGGAGAC